MENQWVEHEDKKIPARWYEFPIDEEETCKISLSENFPCREAGELTSYYVFYYHNDTTPKLKLYLKQMPLSDAKAEALTRIRHFLRNETVRHRNLTKQYETVYRHFIIKMGGVKGMAKRSGYMSARIHVDGDPYEAMELLDSYGVPCGLDSGNRIMAYPETVSEILDILDEGGINADWVA